jgi:hypothetical protein
MQDLEAFIQHLQAQKHDIIVGGDWNDSISIPNSRLLKLSTSLDLVDPWLTFYPHHPEFPTFELGTQRIDSILVSRRLLPSIERIGYSPVGGLFLTDHRTVMLEFNTNNLFGNDTDPLPAMVVSRGVRTKDLQSVTTFIATMHSHLAANNAFKRAMTLTDSTVGASSQTALVENLDRLIGEAGDQGDRACRRRRPHWYSISIVQQRLELSYLRHYRNGLKVGIDRFQATSDRLRHIQKQQQLPEELEDMDALIREKAATLSEATSKSAGERQGMLESHANTLEALHQRARASTLRRINKHEQSLETWKTMAFLTNTATQKLDRLEIPDDWPLPNQTVETTQSLTDPKTATGWRTITDPFEIEYYLMLRNRMHFGQAQGTPFTESPLSDHVDWTATSPSAEEILSGSYVPSETLSQLCQTVLLACKATAPFDTIPATLTPAEFKGKIIRWRETTTTSPSGRHLGRYKALYANGTDSTPEETPTQTLFLQQQREIAAVILHIMNFCIRTGHVLSRWKQIVNTMIFKDIYQLSSKKKGAMYVPPYVW